MAKSRFVYVSYIRTTPEKLWSALTTPEFIRQFWFGCTADCDFKAGSPWKLVYPDGRLADVGKIEESQPPHRLVIRWRNEWNPELKVEGDSLCTMEIEQNGSAVKLSITHAIDRDASKFIEAVSGGWPKVISNLKSLLESGSVALTDPYPAAKQAAA
ncbi:MAG TPA: SRPBCC family protein [Nevskiaceae bacterium]|nr:SRPBCC family protein [Nevskiaceae bacterium]